MKKTLLIIVLAAALALTGTAAAPRSVAAAEKLIAITYDDGPGAYTNELLDALAARNVKATFFLVGTCVQKYPAVVKREYEEGHQLANHTWNHPKLTTLGQSAFFNQLESTENAIDSAVGEDVGKLMLRPPYGSISASQKSMAGRKIILWSVDPLDWKYRDAATVKRNIVSAAREGSIILVHDIHPTSVKGSVAAIDELQSQGYTFVTVSELFRRKGIEMADGRTYTNAPADGVDLGPPEPVDPYAYDETKLSEHWAYEYICYVKENGLMLGFSEDKFGPEYPMTRAMFATVLCRMSGESIPAAKKTPFDDVALGKYYSDAVAWAAENGIVSGYGGGRFGPDDYVTREQAAVMIVNYMKFIGFHVGDQPQVSYTDEADIHHWAKGAVASVTEKGVMNGTGGGAFSPLDNATRAQAATILTRLHQMQQLRVQNQELLELMTRNGDENE
ncbi:MAG: S-layer homology domain-containing protein [Bacillota bacterium]|jgi:peptidoglycan/xylan/chitin deacetylase (PgdA/CDA1 family)